MLSSVLVILTVTRVLETVTVTVTTLLLARCRLTLAVPVGDTRSKFRRQVQFVILWRCLRLAIRVVQTTDLAVMPVVTVPVIMVFAGQCQRQRLSFQYVLAA